MISNGISFFSYHLLIYNRSAFFTPCMLCPCRDTGYFSISFCICIFGWWKPIAGWISVAAAHRIMSIYYSIPPINCIALWHCIVSPIVKRIDYYFYFDYNNSNWNEKQTFTNIACTIFVWNSGWKILWLIYSDRCVWLPVQHQALSHACNVNFGQKMSNDSSC